MLCGDKQTGNGNWQTYKPFQLCIDCYQLNEPCMLNSL